MQKLLNQSLWHIEFRNERPQAKQFFYGPHSFLASKNFRRRSTDLRREYAHPNLPDFRFGTPELDKFLEVRLAFHHLCGNGAMHSYLMTTNAFKNASIGGRLAALVVLRLQPIDRHDNLQSP